MTWKVWEIQPETLKLLHQDTSVFTTHTPRGSGHTHTHLTESCKLIKSPFQWDRSSEESDPTDVTQPWLHYLLKGSCCCCSCTIMSVRAVPWQHEEPIGTRKKFKSTRARQESHARLTVRADTRTWCLSFMEKADFIHRFLWGHLYCRQFIRIFKGN